MEMKVSNENGTLVAPRDCDNDDGRRGRRRREEMISRIYFTRDILPLCFKREKRWPGPEGPAGPACEKKINSLKGK
jgi:hypothetical protein